jgi:Peptidase family M41
VKLKHWLRAVFFRFVRLFVRAPLPALEFVPTPSPDKHYSRERIAVHEAGHAIVAWNATTVEKVTIVARDTDGAVFCPVLHRSPEERLLNLAILLGGIAAECDVYGGFRSGPSGKDLGVARENVQALLSDGVRIVVSEPCSIPFQNMFSDPLSPDEALFFAHAFLVARRLIRDHRTAHRRLTALIATQDLVLQDDVEKILGSRLPAVILRHLGVATLLPMTRDRESSDAHPP